MNLYSRIETDRLILREPELSDDSRIFFLRSDERINEFLLNFRHRDLQQTRDFLKDVILRNIEDKSFYWVIDLVNGPACIGTICLWNLDQEENTAEVGFMLDPAFQSCGYMHEALLRIIHFAFDKLKIAGIKAITHKNNRPSIKLLQRCNFRQTSDHKETFEKDEIYLKLANDY